MHVTLKQRADRRRRAFQKVVSTVEQLRQATDAFEAVLSIEIHEASGAVPQQEYLTMRDLARSLRSQTAAAKLLLPTLQRLQDTGKEK